MKLYVGNLSYDVTDEELRQEFSAFGEVTSVNVVKDKYSGRPKGFAFVEMASKSEAEAAIAGLNGKTLKERTLVVNEARPRPDTRGGGFGGRGRQRG
jgi:cold-inducible RNA-binding protein